MNIFQYIASNVPSLKGFRDKLTLQQNAVFILKDLTLIIFSLQGYANLSYSVLLLNLCYVILYFSIWLMNHFPHFPFLIKILHFRFLRVLYNLALQFAYTPHI